MQSTQDKVSHLLWCILVALRTAHENHQIISERRKRKFIAEWLSGARRLPAFRGMAQEFMTIRELLDTEKQRPIDDVLTALWKNAVSTGNCDLFRFRAVMNALLGQGWKHCLCPWPEQVVTEIMERQRNRKNHILQLTRMEEAFTATGSMTAPVTLQLLLQKGEDVEVEHSFYLDRFSVVRGGDISLSKTTLRTLYIGRHTLPESAWGARDGVSKGNLWRPDLH
ncbi:MULTISPECIES: hypothetical protein [Enterobacteriaceae]|uniref:hypothetical protein n=1 Tax=Enterobacteriaceae TaxID=543 RepID=UPI002949B61A|nr:hypothetical protein [Leclercia adecarboxylata]MDV5565336.1 hypothetical protein [Leclercia adecarboxylata]